MLFHFLMLAVLAAAFFSPFIISMSLDWRRKSRSITPAPKAPTGSPYRTSSEQERERDVGPAVANSPPAAGPKHGLIAKHFCNTPSSSIGEGSVWRCDECLQVWKAYLLLTVCEWRRAELADWTAAGGSE